MPLSDLILVLHYSYYGATMLSPIQMVTIKWINILEQFSNSTEFVSTKL